jgi:two-component system response regulator PhoP
MGSGFVVYSNDHRPRHVHGFFGEAEVIFDLRAVDITFDGEEGLFMAQSSSYDVLVLDLMLPKLSGLQLLKKYREDGTKTPVLVLTARDEKEILVRLLNAGADDYLTKPCDLGEFVARCRALIRRGHGEHSPTIQIGPLILNSTTRTLYVNGAPVTLTAMEYRVIEYLAHRRGALVSKTELLEHLYDFNGEKFSNVIEVYVSGLRRKIDGIAGQKLIHTVRGLGYALRSEAERGESGGLYSR